MGIAPRTGDAETLTLAVMQALLGLDNPVPSQSGYNKPLRKLAATMTSLIGELGRQASGR